MKPTPKLLSFYENLNLAGEFLRFLSENDKSCS